MKKLNFSNIKSNMINYFKNKDFEIKKLYILCALSTLCILTSFWVSAFVIVTCAVACIGVCLIKGAKKVYLLVYLLPFYNILRFKPYSFVLSSIILLVTIIVLALEYLIDIIKKRKKIDYIVTAIFAAILVYIWLPFGPFNLMYTLKLFSTLAILYLVYVFRDDVNFKNLVYFWLIAIIIACMLSHFRFISARLEWFLPDFASNVKHFRRFSGLTADPNYFSVEILLLLACVTQLYFTNQMNHFVFFPVVFTLSVIGFYTTSKAYFISFVLYVILTCVLFLLKKLKNKEKFLKGTICFVITIILASLVCFKHVSSILGRFDDGYVDFENNLNSSQVESVVPPLGNENIDSVSPPTDSIFNDITTGRSEIWILYIKSIIETPVKCLFGHGVGAILPITNHGETSAHNFYLESLYLLGSVGCLMMLGLGVYLFIKHSKKSNRRFANFIPLAVIAVMLFSLNSLISYRTFVLALVLAYSIGLEDKEKKKTFEKGEKNAESISDNERV